jgi:hypothetical protein
MTSFLPRLAATAAALLATTGSACTERDTSTQLTVAITAETEIPRELDTLQVVVTAPNGSEVIRISHDVDTPRFFPTTLAVIPKNERSLDGPVTVEVRGGKTTAFAGQVFRRAIVSYVEGRTLLVPMPLRMACFNFKDCGPSQTCVGGTCRSAAVEPSALVDFNEARVFGGLGGGACFDESKCLASATPVDVRADCTFPVPAADANVSIRWAAAPGRVIVLDGDDAAEGWTRVDAATGKLSSGVCDSLLDKETDPAKRRVPDQALDARVSVTCATKTAALPYCPGADGHSGIGANLKN